MAPQKAMKLARLVVLLPLLVVGCPRIEPVVPPPNPPPDTDLCKAMCDRLSKLACEEAKPVYNSDLPGPVDVPNQTCTDFCTEMQNKGVSVNPRCVIQVERCTQIEEFRQKDAATCGTASAK